MLRVQQHVESDLATTFSPEDLARVAHLSLHHFHRVFRGVTGETVSGYARRLRLERAARQLLGGERPIVDVALDAGYGSHEAFTRAFTRAFGVAPNTFRVETQPPRSRFECEPIEPIEPIAIRDEAERRVVSMRHVGPYEEVSRTWERLAAWLVERAPAGAALPPMFGLVPDDPQITEPARLRYDACFACEPPAEALGDAPITFTTIPAGRYAVALHRGPYDRLADTYLGLIGGWFPTTDHAMAAEPVVERYLNSPHDTPPDALETEIWVRIEERGWLVTGPDQ